MTRFALLIWAYQQTGRATTLALVGFFTFVPYILISPLAGIVVDRFNRRFVLILSDIGEGLMTTAILFFYLNGDLRIWHIYLSRTIAGLFMAFQVPAYRAAITCLVAKTQYTRASALWSLADYMAQVFAPILAGILIYVIHINGIMLIDIITFLMAVSTLLVIHIPNPAPESTDRTTCSSFWQNFSFGFRYILQRRGLLGLLLIFSGINFFAGLTYFSILPVLILARSSGNEMALATVQATLGVGGIVGATIVTLWGGPKRLIHGILAGAGASFILGDILFATGRSIPVWTSAAFLSALFIPLIDSANRSLWQKKVAPNAQGRVFSVQGMAQQMSLPLAYILAGPLADRLFEPAMSSGGLLADTFGWLVGTGPGAGIAIMFLCTAVSGMLASVSGYIIPVVRNVETDLPDYDEISVSIRDG